MRRVAIIGCGPAGLLAAHAAVLADAEPTVFSKVAAPSPNAAASYLHTAIPDITSREPDDHIDFQKVGTPEGYAKKVYGSEDAPTSWAKFREGPTAAWSLAAAYGTLWHLYRDTVREREAFVLTPYDLLAEYDLVINTAPATQFCYNSHEHKFPYRPTWVYDGAPPSVGENTMVYNGDYRTQWMRSSDCFGVRSTEYSKQVIGGSKGIKVLPTTCDCWPDMIRAGRWGTWKPGVLVHHAFEEARRALL